MRHKTDKKHSLPKKQSSRPETGAENRDGTGGRKKRYTLRDAWRMNLRALRLWNRILPRFWLWESGKVLLDAAAPYFGLYLSALMINELAGACDVRRLLVLAAVTVGGGFLLALLQKLVSAQWAILRRAAYRSHEAYMMACQNAFQYAHLEDPDLFLLRARIFENMDGGGLGMPLIKENVFELLRAFLDLLLSVSLTASLFVLRSSSACTGLLGFVNAPQGAAALAALILGGAVLSVAISAARATRGSRAAEPFALTNARFLAYRDLKGPDMRMFGLYDILHEEWRRSILRPDHLSKMGRVMAYCDGCSVLAGGLINLAVFLFTAAKAFLGVIGIGSFVLYQGAVSRFCAAVGQLAAGVGRMHYNLPYLQQEFDYLDLPNEMYKGTLAVEKRDDLDYEIEFRDVSFRYPRTENWSLRHVSIKFSIGDKLAIVGENGSGKTTFIKLLCRLYDPTEGKILLNGIDITRYRYDEYLALFSVVFQDFTLFDFSLGELVAAGPHYDAARARDCLCRAGLAEKVAALEAGGGSALTCFLGREYDSEGIELSGGERQKVALARALYKDAPFVVLDEPTAALDPIAEAAVYENFNRLVQQKTAVFISHRLSSCRFCDAIAVFECGRLVQLGTHDALLTAPDGKYRQLWHAQAQYYNSKHE